MKRIVFAITGMRAKRAKSASNLSFGRDPMGSVPKRRQTIADTLWCLKGVEEASVEDLMTVEAFPRALAEEIYQRLR